MVVASWWMICSLRSICLTVKAPGKVERQLRSVSSTGDLGDALDGVSFPNFAHALELRFSHKDYNANNKRNQVKMLSTS